MVAFEHPHPHGPLLPTGHLALPFFDDTHRALVNRLVAWAGECASTPAPRADTPDRRSEVVRQEFLAFLGDTDGASGGPAADAATALGLARRALAAGVAQSKRQQPAGAAAAEALQSALGMVHQRIETAALLTYRAAWAQDLHPRPETGHPGLEAAQQTADLQAAIGHALAAAGLAADLLGDRAPSATAMVRALEQRIGQLQADPVQHQRALHTLGGLVLKA